MVGVGSKENMFKNPPFLRMPVTSGLKSLFNLYNEAANVSY